MPPSLRRRFVLVALLLALLAAPRLVIYGQGQPIPAIGYGRAVTLMLADPAPASSAYYPRQGRRSVLLPLVLTPPRLTVATAAAINETTAEPISPTDSFRFGITRLYLTMLFEGARGQSYQIEATFPSGTVVRSASLRVPGNTFRDSVYLCVTPTGVCGSGELALDRGTYTYRVFLEGVLYAERSATIR